MTALGRWLPPAAARQALLLGLAVLTGLIAGGVVLAFRWLSDTAQSAFLPGGKVGNYEALHHATRLILPVAGAMLLGTWFRHLDSDRRQVGVVHVLDRLVYHGGRLPLPNAVVQFIGGVLAIVTGQSVDREGPGVHLGGAVGSLLGQRLGYSDATLRPLIACGTAASIAVAFNTPLAGVVFALEVVTMEYTVVSISPVILASVIGAVIGRSFYGPEPAFAIPSIGQYSLSAVFFAVPLGVVTGLVAASFVSMVERMSRLTATWEVRARFVFAGALTGLCAQWVPEIMGISYDTVQRILTDQVGLLLLVGIVLAKVLATATAVGVGLPGGLIGGTLVLGAACGGAMGHLAAGLWPDPGLPAVLVAMVGMAAMMGAVLQAPLAALTALLELTDDPHVILPGMLAVVTADWVAIAAGQDSVFLTLVRSRSGRA